MQKPSRKGENLIGGGLFILFLSLIWVIIDVFFHMQFQSYQIGQCTITAKQLTRTDLSAPLSTNPTIIETRVSYEPDLQFTLQVADGRHYQTHGYAFQSLASPDYTQEEGQAIIDQFQVGSTYQCWYEPTNPYNAILDHTYIWDIRADAIGVISLICLFIGIIRASRQT